MVKFARVGVLAISCLHVKLHHTKMRKEKQEISEGANMHLIAITTAHDSQHIYEPSWTFI
jgi:hypothetical protein